MADGTKPLEPESTDQAGPEPETVPEKGRPRVTRRDFLVRSNAGAAVVGIMTGVGFAATLEQARPAVAPAPRPAPLPAPMATRRVTLDVDGRRHDVTVDVRESLWETLTNQLGSTGANLGCDRAQCGACTVLVDGRPVTSCSVLTARLGRGQKILTVAGIAPGPGRLHPIQHAFWLEGGFQCGICTRGFVMTTYALLKGNPNPTDAEIKDALSGNICRCGEYVGILSSVKKAAAEMRGETVTYASRLPAAAVAAPAGAAPAQAGVSKQFEFVNPLGTIEVFDELALDLRRAPGILGVSGTERTITPVWDPARLDEARVRQLLAETGHPVKP
ncbi:MAG: (2Fe-2S)-binding protein [Vicinamibacterales bacterium]|nr:(2Fe-2S)-binding protein [Vicinamibacterales bacterium]